MGDNVILVKSKTFALRIIKLHQFLNAEKREYILSKQLLRSGTSIGANVREAVYAFSKKDFATKMSIALKEASETAYWLELLFESDYITEPQYNHIYSDCEEVIKLLASIVKSSKKE